MYPTYLLSFIQTLYYYRVLYYYRACVFMPQDMWWAEGSFPESTFFSTIASRDEMELMASGLGGRQGLSPAELASPCNVINKKYLQQQK